MQELKEYEKNLPAKSEEKKKKTWVFNKNANKDRKERHCQAKGQRAQEVGSGLNNLTNAKKS